MEIMIGNFLWLAAIVPIILSIVKIAKVVLNAFKVFRNDIAEKMGYLLSQKLNGSIDLREKVFKYKKQIYIVYWLRFLLKPSKKYELHYLYWILGNCFYYLFDWKRAIKSLENALDHYSNFPEAWNNKGVALMRLERYEEAIGDFDKAIKINPKFELAWYNKGNALVELGKYLRELIENGEVLSEEAEECYGKFIRTFGEAIKCCDKAIEINPNNELAWINKGVALGNLGSRLGPFGPSNLGKIEEAIESLDKAIEINPNNELAWITKSLVLDYFGKYLRDLIMYGYEETKKYYGKFIRTFEEMIYCCDKAIEINPNNELAWINKGVALYHLGFDLSNLGKIEEAIESLDKAIEINPNNEKVWNLKGIALRTKSALIKSNSNSAVG